MEFAEIYVRLAQRCRALAGERAAEVTLVFDKGNNSKDTLELVAREGLHFVSSLVAGQHKDILAVPLASYREVNPTRWPKLLSYRTTKKVFGAERVVLATFNPALWAGQMQGLNAQRAKIESAMAALQAKLARWAELPAPKGQAADPAKRQRRRRLHPGWTRAWAVSALHGCCRREARRAFCRGRWPLSRARSRARLLAVQCAGRPSAGAGGAARRSLPRHCTIVYDPA